MNPLFEQKHIIQTFNHAAGTYTAAAMLPETIGLRLIERLELTRLQPELIVDLGCATGHLTKFLVKRYAKATVLGIDLADKMLLHARKQARWLSRERFIGADANCLPLPAQSIDLIFANLMFAWCNDIDILLIELRRVLKPAGLLLFTTLGPDTLQEVKASWREIDNYPHVHPFLDMHDIGDSLVKNKFLDPVMDMEKLTVNYSHLKTLMNDLKFSGMHNISAQRKRGFMTPRQFTKFAQAYEKYRTPGNHLPVSFEIIYGHAWTYELAGSSVNANGDVVIPITKIKRKHI